RVCRLDQPPSRVPLIPYTTLFRSVLIPAPSGGGNDGVHTIDYYSTDKAGNTEATKHATVRIDTVTPVSSASGPNQVTNSSPFTIPYTVSDASPSSGIAKVELYVKGPAD